MSQGTPFRLSAPIVRIVVAVAACALLVCRLSSILARPQFWAEDGGVFFADATSGPAHGLDVIFLSYAGYLHLIPRLIAMVGSFLPVFWGPAFYAYTSIVVLGVVAWAIQSPRIQLPGAWLAALALGAIPHTGEVYGVICNIQWVTALLLFGILIADDPDSKVTMGMDIAGVVVAGLTGPFVVLSLPFFLFRAWQRESRKSWILLITALGCFLLQLPSLLFHRPVSDEHHPWNLPNLISVLGHRMFVTLFVGDIHVSPFAAGSVFFVCGLTLFLIVWYKRDALPGALPMSADAALVVLASVVKVRFDQLPFGDVRDGDRYFFTGKIILVWLLAALASRTTFSVRAGIYAAFALALWSNYTSFVYAPFPDMDWPKYAKIIQRREPVKVPILPAGFYLWYSGTHERPHWNE